MNQDNGQADALARYLGADFEVHQRDSGIVGVRRKALDTVPDYGTTKVAALNRGRFKMYPSGFVGRIVEIFEQPHRVISNMPNQHIPQGMAVPY